jgi:hypothetical protein
MAEASFGDRLQKALSVRSVSRTDLAKVLRTPDGGLGISTSAIGQVVRGESNAMSAENTVRAARFLRISPFWLATGEGPMEEAGVHARAPEPPPYLDVDVVRRMGQLLARVDPALRDVAADLLAGWARSGGDETRADLLLGLLAKSGKQQAA